MNLLSSPDFNDPDFNSLAEGCGLPLGRAIAVAASLLLPAPAPLFGQTATPTTPTVVTGGRSLTLEVIVVVVMFGLALFAVCRSSRRN